MITAYKTYGVRCATVDMYGLSTDTKPTNVGNASTFYEMDTKNMLLVEVMTVGEDFSLTIHKVISL